MRKTAITVASVVAPIAALAIATPGVSSAEPLNCPGGWWDPTANVCRAIGEGPQPLNCPGGWWDPTANVCRPLGQGPQPLNCENGSWWDPTSNTCAPPLIPPTNP